MTPRPALLSGIALYLALPKVETDQATLSDTISMVTYAAVSLMIGLQRPASVVVKVASC